MNYEFSNEWFVPHAPVWDELLKWCEPSAVLEIGSYEGRSTCFLIEHIGKLRPAMIHCVDTWEGGVEHERSEMQAVERRFDTNTEIALSSVGHNVDFHKHKGESKTILPKLLTSGFNAYFDLIYIDGSHQAPDVLFDAVIAFSLLKVGGILVFDDYLWQMEQNGHENHYNMPKPAVDAFTNIYRRKLKLISAPLFQFYLQKTSD